MYVLIWEYEVDEESAPAFEEVYGPEGDWSRLFDRGEGFSGTELLRDATTPGRYVTIDRWTSEEAFEAFHREWGEEYQVLDALHESLTTAERFLGAFRL